MSSPAISNYIPNIRIASPEQIVENLKRISIPVITLAAASMINEAQAIGYVECMDNCNEHRDVHDLARLLCYTLRLIFAKD